MAAAQCYRAACAMQPGFAEAWANLGLALDQGGDAHGAEQAYKQALAAGCDAFELHLNLGALLAAQRRHEEALAHYARAMQQDDRSAALWSNLGALHLGLQQDADARTCLEKALQLAPGHASAQVNLAYVLLRHGHYAQGWAALEARNWYDTLAATLPCQRWQGQALQGRTLLLVEQAGHGDVLQFVRFVPTLKAQGAGPVALVCHAALVEVLSTVEGLDTVVSNAAALPAALASQAAFWSPLMSLPHLLQTGEDTQAQRIPYVQADPARMALWEPRMVQGQTAAAQEPRRTVRVGLVWQGNPAFENDAARSIASFELLEPLLAVPGCMFYSLQKGAQEQAPALCNAQRAAQGLAPYPIQTLGGDLQDFADAAAVLVQLDMLVTVDTAMAHMAGALGVRCWLLLPDYMADWRWGQNAGASATATPWYPGSMRLWRQPRGGDWPTVVQAVAHALRELCLDVQEYGSASDVHRA